MDKIEDKEEFYRIIADYTYDWEYLMGPDRQLLYCSPSCERITGYNRDEFIADPSLLLNIIHPDDIGRFKGHYDQERCRLRQSPIEFRIIRKDGQINWVEHACSPVFDSQGHFIGRRGSNRDINRDITERRRYENSLRESEGRYRAVIENSKDAVALLKENMYIFVNQSFVQMFGYDTPGDIIGKDQSITIHPDDLERVVELNTKSRSEDVCTYTFNGIKKDGSAAIVDASAAKIIMDGKPVTLLYLRDITGNRKLEAQLMQAQKMEAIGQLAAGVAHDFNNILTAILGFGNLLQMDIDKDDRLRLNVDMILASAEKAAKLTHSLLAFSRQQVVDLKPVNVESIINNVSKLLQRLIPEDINLTTVVHDNDIVVMADENQIDQVLINLAANARDTMPRGGNLTIELKRIVADECTAQLNGIAAGDTYACLAVTDTGSGMSEETLKKIFDPFFTTKKVGEGTGLGLSIVHGIVKQHKGLIDVRSNPGRGTTFYIYLPAVDEQPNGQAEKYTIRMKKGIETVLLVEDDNSVRNFASRVLCRHGYTVLEAQDGEEALKIFKTHKDMINLTILDVVLPKRNGREVYEVIGNMKPGIKVLFTSGYADNIICEKGIRGEEIDFIHKPVVPTELLTKVREMLDRKSQYIS